MLGKRNITDIRKAFEAYAPLSDEAWTLVSQKLETVVIRKGESFVACGDASIWIGFLEKGLFRAFYLSPKGDDMTTNFCAEGSFISSYAAAIKQKHSRVSIEALEDSTIIRLKIENFRKILIDSAEWTKVGLRMLEEYYIFHEDRIANLMTLNATDRYLDFCQLYSSIEKRLNQNHIASYIGVTREALSRLKKARIAGI